MLYIADGLCNYDHEFTDRFYGLDYDDLMESGKYDDTYYEPFNMPIVEYDGVILNS
jgi:hypothetical protein